MLWATSIFSPPKASSIEYIPANSSVLGPIGCFGGYFEFESPTFSTSLDLSTNKSNFSFTSGSFWGGFPPSIKILFSSLAKLSNYSKFIKPNLPSTDGLYFLSFLLQECYKWSPVHQDYLFHLYPLLVFYHLPATPRRLGHTLLILFLTSLSFVHISPL